MSSSNPSDLSTAAIIANLKKMHELLLNAMHQSTLAQESLKHSHCTEAIGALLGLGATLDDAKALLNAAVLLHRWRRN